MLSALRSHRSQLLLFAHVPRNRLSVDYFLLQELVIELRECLVLFWGGLGALWRSSPLPFVSNWLIVGQGSCGPLPLNDSLTLHAVNHLRVVKLALIHVRPCDWLLSAIWILSVGVVRSRGFECIRLVHWIWALDVDYWAHVWSERIERVLRLHWHCGVRVFWIGWRLRDQVEIRPWLLVVLLHHRVGLRHLILWN